jgi:hypothetical protein
MAGEHEEVGRWKHGDSHAETCWSTGGCNCSISSNNILNPFTPFGDGSLIRMANLHANILQIAQHRAWRSCSP